MSNNIILSLSFSTLFLLLQLENGRLLSTSDAAYLRTCLRPGGNSEPLRALQEPHKSGFLL